MTCEGIIRVPYENTETGLTQVWLSKNQELIHSIMKPHTITKLTDFDKIFKLDIGNVLNMMCAKFEVHTSHRSEDPHENVHFSQKS